jgi:hypothetical protein
MVEYAPMSLEASHDPTGSDKYPLNWGKIGLAPMR